MGATRNTTPTAEASRRHGRLPALIAGVLALTVLGLAVPRLVAAILALPARSVIERLATHPSMATAADLTAAVGALEKSGKWVRDGEADGLRGRLLAALAQAARTPQEAARLRTAARNATVTGLVAAPVQPASWARLAYLEAVEGRQAPAAAALRMSLLAGPVVPELMPSRLALALAIWPALGTEVGALALRQARLLVTIDFLSLAPLGQSGPQAWRIRETLGDLTFEQRRALGWP